MNIEQLPPIDVTHHVAHRPIWRRWFMLACAVFAILVLGTVICTVRALGPVDPSSTRSIRFVVTSGETASAIATSLHEQGLIQQPFMFQMYTQLTGTKSKLQAGGYVLKPSYSVAQIVDHLTSGKTDEVSVTVLPGLTLEQLADPDVKGSLAQQGFTKSEIAAAFAVPYDGPLFVGKPTGGSLEGYVYPETYKIMANDPLDTVLRESFKEFYAQIQTKGITEGLTRQQLSLRDGIILASIVGKEVSNPTDQRQVAQVFLKRLHEGSVLGSDVTFLYIAHKEGRTPSVNDPSPYNTRRVAGLPPGPIANFNLSALQAVADPAPGDYLYFVAGDDGTTHFSKTEAEHLDNVARYCKVLCQ
jgi:UPF0755 protein